MQRAAAAKLLLALAGLLCLGSASSASAASVRARSAFRRPIGYSDGSRTASYNCADTRWFTQRLDHFSRRKEDEHRTYQQRYVVCDKWWSTAEDGTRGPIFFYAGNEGSLDLYINNTGLMWENAESFGALVVFAEHRYYGQSEPFGKDSWKVDPSYLTVEQALADYATLLWDITRGTPGAEDSPVIVFGGSYGGELAAWMRLKYPHLVHGAIAASAPIAGFPGVPGFNPSDFWKVVTYGASPEGGAPPLCVNNTRLAFKIVMNLRTIEEDRPIAQKLLRLCDPLKSAEDVEALGYWLQGAWDAFAMGNFPYPSSYINGDPDHPLPAWPMRAACYQMTKTLHMRQTDLLTGLADVASIMYNATGDLKCFKLDVSGPAAGNTGPWDFQFCTELMAQEQPYFPANGVTDMFWDQGPYDTEGIEQHCQETWGVKPEWHWAVTELGGAQLAERTSNIVFSNGLLDPWSAFGILHNVSDSVVAVLIPDGAHHVDLMFSSPKDTPTIKAARQVELSHIRKWVAQAQEAAALRKQQQQQLKAASGQGALGQQHQLLKGRPLKGAAALTVDPTGARGSSSSSSDA